MQSMLCFSLAWAYQKLHISWWNFQLQKSQMAAVIFLGYTEIATTLKPIAAMFRYTKYNYAAKKN